MIATSITVRPALRTDVDAVWPLVADFATSYRPEIEVFRSAFLAVLTSEAAHVLVAERGTQVVGYLLAHKQATFFASAPVLWVEELMVGVAHRRAGIGSALLTGAEAWAIGQGCAYISLASRRAGPFYVALGYVESAAFFEKVLLPQLPVSPDGHVPSPR